MTQLKKCPKCGKELPYDDFYVNKSKKDGLSTYCKKCHVESVNMTREKKRQRKSAPKTIEEARQMISSRVAAFVKPEQIITKSAPVIAEPAIVEEPAANLIEKRDKSMVVKKADKTLDDFTPREMFGYLYKKGYRIEEGELVCYIKHKVNIKDIIANG